MVLQIHGSVPTLRRPAGRAGPRRALVSLAPLIDVVLILLFFFMLASSFQDWRAIILNAKQRGAMAPSTQMEGALLVEIRPEGLRLSAEPVSLAVLATRVGRRAAEQPELRVLVRPARGVSLQATVQILDVLAAAGVASPSLVSAGQYRDPGHAL